MVGPTKLIILNVNLKYFHGHQFNHMLWVLKTNRPIEMDLLSTHNVCIG